MVITLSIFCPVIRRLRPLYSSLAPNNLKLVKKSKLSLSNELAQKINSKSSDSPGGIFTINSLKSSPRFSSSLSSLFSDSSPSSSSSSNDSSFFSFSSALIKCSLANLSFSGKINLKSLKRTSLFKLTTTLASNFELFLNVNKRIVGSLKLTPPKSNLSWTMNTSG